MKKESVNCERYMHNGYIICVYRVVSGNTAHFETEVCQKVTNNDTGLTEYESIEIVNITGNVSKYDAKSQCELAMCSLFTGKVWIDNNL